MVDEASSLSKAIEQIVERFKRGSLGADETEDDALICCHVSQRRKVAPARAIEFKEQMRNTRNAEQRLGDGVAAAFGQIFALEVAAAHVHADRHSGWRAGDRFGDRVYIERSQLGRVVAVGDVLLQSLTVLRIVASWAAAKPSSSRSSAAKARKAWRKGGGRSKLPIWSARNGGRCKRHPSAEHPCGCACGRTHVRAIGSFAGRADDLINLRGIKMFPGQIEHAVRSIAGIGDEFEIVLTTNSDGLDVMTVRVEHRAGTEIGAAVADEIRSRCEVRAGVEVLAPAPCPGPNSKRRGSRTDGKSAKLPPLAFSPVAADIGAGRLAVDEPLANRVRSGRKQP
jgi:AMP-binding enzyme C-terminal domain